MGGKDESATWGFENALRSDLLPNLVGLLRAFPALQAVSPAILQVCVVIDASIVQGELRWRLKRRKNPRARTALHEVLACGVLVGYAPHYLEEEINEHAEQLASETGKKVTDVQREWVEFKANLCFYTARKQLHGNHVDIDDAPYLDTMQEIAARAIYSPDRHFLHCDSPLIRVSLDSKLRQYARASSVRVGIVMGSSVSIAVSVEALLALSRLLAKIAAAAKRIPPAVQLLILAGAVAAIAHPRSRKKLLELWKRMIATVGPVIGKAVLEWFEQYSVASKSADESQQEIERLLPAKARRPLIAHARAVCLAARRPLRIDEIAAAAVANGYVPRSTAYHIYLRRVLREDDRFVKSSGSWSFVAR